MTTCRNTKLHNIVSVCSTVCACASSRPPLGVNNDSPPIHFKEAAAYEQRDRAWRGHNTDRQQNVKRLAGEGETSVKRPRKE